MFSTRCLAVVLSLGAGAFLSGCGGSGSGVAGKYTSVAVDALTMELKSGGTVVMTAAGVGSSKGTYVMDGEKIVITVDGQKYTLIRDGNCIQDQQDFFGKMCKGGKAGAASNVSTRAVPAAPTGTWVATNADGTFKLAFAPGNSVTMTATPQGGGNADSRQGTFQVQGDEVYVTLSGGEPLVLKFVNGGYESTSFGPMMRFVKQ